jgi:hypothetical protein
MSKSTPDHHDADLVLKIYDMRREPVMRESRDAINKDFWPRNEAEALAVTQPEHPLNRQYRQTSSYWEMVFGMAKHGIVHADYLCENGGDQPAGAAERRVDRELVRRRQGGDGDVPRAHPEAPRRQVAGPRALSAARAA